MYEPMLRVWIGRKWVCPHCRRHSHKTDVQCGCGISRDGLPEFCERLSGLARATLHIRVSPATVCSSAESYLPENNAVPTTRIVRMFGNSRFFITPVLVGFLPAVVLWFCVIPAALTLS
jgi:hypothetical protein